MRLENVFDKPRTHVASVGVIISILTRHTYIDVDLCDRYNRFALPYLGSIEQHHMYVPIFLAIYSRSFFPLFPRASRDRGRHAISASVAPWDNDGAPRSLLLPPRWLRKLQTNVGSIRHANYTKVRRYDIFNKNRDIPDIFLNKRKI